MRKSKGMASIDNSQIFELLQSLNLKVDEQQRTLADTQSRVAGLEAAIRAQTDASNRSSSTTEDRLQRLERERALQKDLENIEFRTTVLEKSETISAGKVTLTYGIFSLVGSGAISAIVAYAMKHLL